MASEIGDLYVILRAVTDPFKAGLKDAAAEGEAATSRIGGAFQALSKVGIVAGGAALAIGTASVKWAADFETQMTRLYTAAGLSNDQLKAVGMTSAQLNDAVLKLGDQTGFTGTQMAEALYHPISASLDLASSLEVVKYAAEEARISGASLEDTTYALSSVMKAFNQNASDAGPTMALLNAIVGEGDMRFQDFNESVKNWAPTAAEMGISIQSIGAGLAYLTDRGNSAEVAATRVTMGLTMMTTPSKQAAKLLEGMGLASSDVKASSEAMTQALQDAHITQNDLALDLQKPDGLYVALKHLKDGLEQAGVSGTEADSILAKIFGGGRSDKAIMSLIQDLGGLKDKYDAIGNDSSMDHFQSAFEKTQQTFNAKLKDLEATLVNLGIKLGTVLLPYVEKFLGWVQRGVDWLMKHKGAAEALAGALATTLVAAIIAVGGAMATALGPELAIAAGIMALGSALVYAYNHSTTFHRIVNEIGRYLATEFKAAWQVAGQVVHWFATEVLPAVKAAIHDVIAWFEAHKEDFHRAWDKVLKDVHAAVKWFDDNVLKWLRERVNELIKWWRDHSQEIHQAWKEVWTIVEAVTKAWWDGSMKPTLAIIQAIWGVVWGSIKDSIKTIWDAIKDVITGGIHFVENIIAIALDVITGNWGKAWQDLKRLAVQAFGDLTNFFGDLTENFGSLLYDAGKNIVRGLVRGIKALADAPFNAVSDIVSGIRDLLPHSPAKTGPLSGNGSPDISGAKIGSMLADGMNSSAGLVAGASRRMISAASLAVSGPTTLGGSLPALAAGGLSGGVPVINNYITVQGSVLTDNDLRDVLQQEMLRLGLNNSQTWQSYQRR